MSRRRLLKYSAHSEMLTKPLKVSTVRYLKNCLSLPEQEGCFKRSNESHINYANYVSLRNFGYSHVGLLNKILASLGTIFVVVGIKLT